MDYATEGIELINRDRSNVTIELHKTEPEGGLSLITAWQCRNCGQRGGPEDALAHASLHINLCGQVDPEIVAARIARHSPDIKRALSEYVRELAARYPCQKDTGWRPGPGFLVGGAMAGGGMVTVLAGVLVIIFG